MSKTHWKDIYRCHPISDDAHKETDVKIISNHRKCKLHESRNHYTSIRMTKITESDDKNIILGRINCIKLGDGYWGSLSRDHLILLRWIEDNYFRT